MECITSLGTKARLDFPNNMVCQFQTIAPLMGDFTNMRWSINVGFTIYLYSQRNHGEQLQNTIYASGNQIQM